MPWKPRPTIGTAGIAERGSTPRRARRWRAAIFHCVRGSPPSCCFPNSPIYRPSSSAKVSACDRRRPVPCGSGPIAGFRKSNDSANDRSEKGSWIACEAWCRSASRGYQKEVSADPADLKEVGKWAMNNGLWHPRPADVQASFAREMADALQEETRIDKAGRPYRAKIAAVSQIPMAAVHSFKWADIDLAPRSHAEKSFQQTR